MIRRSSLFLSGCLVVCASFWMDGSNLPVSAFESKDASAPVLVSSDASSPVLASTNATVSDSNPPRLQAAADALCDDPTPPRWIEINSAALDSINLEFSRYNQSVVWRADSLLRAGAYGDPESEEARARAVLYLQLRCRNAMESIFDLANGPGVAWLDRPEEFENLLSDYSNIAMYPLRQIVRARVGMGAFCMQYDIPERFEQVLPLGDSSIRMRSDRLRRESGEKVRIWSREWLAGDGDKLELLYEENFTGQVSKETIVDEGDEIEITSFSDLRGVYVRRHGVHRLQAMVFWRNRTEGDELPGHPRIGAAAYFPHIRIELPVFLPDLGLDDLREFAYPPPILQSRLFVAPEASFPSWLRGNTRGEFLDWRSRGPRPCVIDQRFPDL